LVRGERRRWKERSLKREVACGSRRIGRRARVGIWVWKMKRKRRRRGGRRCA